MKIWVRRMHRRQKTARPNHAACTRSVNVHGLQSEIHIRMSMCGCVYILSTYADTYVSLARYLRLGHIHYGHFCYSCS